MSRPSEKDRNETKIFNVGVGTATGWDQMSDWGVCLYDFEPYPGFDVPAGDIGVDFETGTIQHYDVIGNVTVEKSIMIVMNGFLGYQNRPKNQSSNDSEVVEAQESSSSSK